jgi:hypothetical protein
MDIRDWGKFIRGRWDWTRSGYEAGFPRKCQFTDLDAALEFDGHRLVIETKHYDGVGDLPGKPDDGQLRFLRDEASLGKTVLVLYGCGSCNDPHAMHELGTARAADRFEDWRGLGKPERRKRLKYEIDRAMGLT